MYIYVCIYIYTYIMYIYLYIMYIYVSYKLFIGKYDQFCDPYVEFTYCGTSFKTRVGGANVDHAQFDEVCVCICAHVCEWYVRGMCA